MNAKSTQTDFPVQSVSCQTEATTSTFVDEDFALFSGQSDVESQHDMDISFETVDTETETEEEEKTEENKSPT